MDLSLTPLIPLCLLLGMLTSNAGAPARFGSRPERPPLAVLTYHHVKWLKPSDDAIERGLTVLPNQFDAQLSYLARQGYHTMTARALAGDLHAGSGWRTRSVLLTFDDGYSDVYQTVYPALLRRHMAATFFVVPGFLGAARYLTWKQVETMAAHGMDIEAHTMTHPDLTVLQAAAVRAEVTRSRAALQSHLHTPVRVFAYPYGASNAAVVSEVSRAGYWCAFTTKQGYVSGSPSPLELPRVYVDIDDTLAIFAGRLRGDAAILAADPT